MPWDDEDMREIVSQRGCFRKGRLEASLDSSDNWNRLLHTGNRCTEISSISISLNFKICGLQLAESQRQPA